MARVFRARGREVIDTAAKAGAPPVIKGAELDGTPAAFVPPVEPIAEPRIAEPRIAEPIIETKQSAAVEAAETEAPTPLTQLEFAKSSNLRTASLDDRGVVTVAFANGTTYQYANFSAELMLEWQNAKSAGSWFHQNVRSKPDRHPVTSPAPSVAV